MVDAEGSSSASGLDQYSEADEDDDLQEDTEDDGSRSSSHHSGGSGQGSRSSTPSKTKKVSPVKKVSPGKAKKTKTLDEVLASVKYRSYRKMCTTLASEDMVGAVNARVQVGLKTWMETRMVGMREETRVIAQRIVDEPINWIAYDKASPGGKNELELMDFEGRAKSLDCVALWRQLEDVAAQYSWTVNARCSHMSMGSSLKGQAKEVIRQAKAAGDEVLNSATPLVGDIVAGLLKYYQLKFRYLVLVGKPTNGAVINKWMEEVLFDTDTADGKLGKYQEIRKYHLMKSSSTPADLYNELARQSAKTEVGKSWWREITQRLRHTEDMQIQMGNA
jgi:hypothetical protein